MPVVTAQTLVLDESPSGIRELMLCIGKTVDSAEFKKVKSAHGLRLWETKQNDRETHGDTSIIVRDTWVTYRGTGIRVYAHKHEYLRRDTNESIFSAFSSAQIRVSHVSLLLGECDENLWTRDRWTGDLPKIVMPDSPAMLLRTYTQPEYDRTEEEFTNWGEDRRRERKRRTVSYAFQFSSVDSFPFTFVFEDDVLAMLTIRATFNHVICVPPTPPKEEPKSPEPTPCAVMPRATLPKMKSPSWTAFSFPARGMPAQGVAHL
ncbi:MAG: hypothetical protein Q7S40_12235 [Opitutaceae bacterium]|nr:hypothetical protein [Opitutaceae bacterium]